MVSEIVGGDFDGNAPYISLSILGDGDPAAEEEFNQAGIQDHRVPLGSQALQVGTIIKYLPRNHCSI